MVPNLDRESLLEQINNLTIWNQRGQRAPHKPLLLILALAELANEKSRLIPFEYIDKLLGDLLRDFGPPRKFYQPEYPFWHLQNDGGFWEVPERQLAVTRRGDRKRTKDVPAPILREVHAHGGFTPEAFLVLKNDTQLVNQVVAELLEAHFPASLHEPILDAVGMPWRPTTSWQEASGSFREQLLTAYGRRCAVCSFDGCLAGSDLCLEAAHVKWRKAQGPDTTNNGLLLCNFHHRLLDRGALGLTPEGTILVSQHVHGSDMLDYLLLRHSGEPLRNPQLGYPGPAPEYVAWHAREVFRGPARMFG